MDTYPLIPRQNSNPLKLAAWRVLTSNNHVRSATRDLGIVTITQDHDGERYERLNEQMVLDDIAHPYGSGVAKSLNNARCLIQLETTVDPDMLITLQEALGIVSESLNPRIASGLRWMAMEQELTRRQREEC